jgi:hypothetical protein
MHGKRILAGSALLGLTLSIHAANLDTIGITALRNADASLTGTGVRVAQPEGGAPTWQVNPTVMGQPVSLFTWISGSGSSTAFPNALGQESGHANAVGGNYYSASGSPAPGVASVDNYEAGHFLNTVIGNQTAIRARVVSQSFVTASGPSGTVVEAQYDNYVATHNTIIVSGAGNDASPLPPSTAYNVISVAAFGGLTAVGPTANGRSKPDITAPAEVTSYSTPQVAGIAGILHQAAARNDAGAGTAATATNAQTIRALLMNGAVKPLGWTNGTAAPLDGRYGAGIVNAYNSWLQLSGGKRAYIESTAPSAGGAHLPGSNPANVAVLRGWDFNSLTTTVLNDDVNHYYFNLNAATAGRFSLTATLIWHRRVSQSAPYNLELFLYDTANNTLVASSQSSVDNVEHIFIPNLPAGRYDLQVLKRGGIGLANTENYALAFDFQPVKLALTRAGNSLQVSWPVSASGFILQGTTSTSLTNGWSAVSATPGQTNGWNVVSITPNNNQQFFRLARP